MSTSHIFNLLLALSFFNFFANSAIASKEKKPVETTETTETQEIDKAALAAQNAAYERTSHYVNKWIKVPNLNGARLGLNGDLNYEHMEGRMAVFVFLASWSEPSQNMMKNLHKIEQKYSPLDTDFFYIFAHDTREDAEGFLKHFELNSGILANNQILSDFKVEQLPTILVGDRQGWLTQIYQNVVSKDIVDLNDFLKLQTAL